MAPNTTANHEPHFLDQPRRRSLFPPPRQILTAPPTDRVPVIRSPGEYRVDYEQVGDITFVHVAVDRWTPSIKTKFAQDIDRAGQLHGGPFFVLCPKTDTKLRRFCSLFGFTYAMDIRTKDGIDGEILVKRIR